MGIFNRIKKKAGGQFFDDLDEHLDSEQERLMAWLDTPGKREKAAREIRNNIENMDDLVTQDMVGSEAYEELMDELAFMYSTTNDVIERADYNSEDIETLKGHVEFMYGNARDVLEGDYEVGL